MAFLILILILLIGLIQAEDCSSCVSSGKLWCVELSQCGTSFSNCSTTIDVSLNCPTLPKYEYNDTFVRNEIMLLTSAVHNENPQICFDNHFPTMQLYKIRTVNCSKKYDDVTCVGYTAYDTTRKVIAISYKGANGENQIKDLGEGIEKYGLKSYYNVTNGKTLKIAHDYFLALWNGGMEQDLRYLNAKYPDYELWLTGHSMGSSLAWSTSAWVVDNGLYTPDKINVIVMGAPRFSDYNFAAWHTKTFPYNFHILHRDDVVAHLPRYVAATNTTMFYPKTEIWYRNSMREEDPYEICQQADGDYCSQKSNVSKLIDHMYYFDIQMSDWGRDGCPFNITDYSQSLIE